MRFRGPFLAFQPIKMTTPVVDRKQSARALIDDAKKVFNVSSLYAVAKRVGLPADYVQRYYRENSIPLPSRVLISAFVNDARE